MFTITFNGQPTGLKFKTPEAASAYIHSVCAVQANKQPSQFTIDFV